MQIKTFPTKGNLILTKNTLALAKQGYELLDRKRNILIREMMELIESAKELQKTIDLTFAQAYGALQRANISMGIEEVEHISHALPIENSVDIKFRSVMGSEIPVVSFKQQDVAPSYGFFRTTSALDEAFVNFNRVKELSLQLSMLENAVYRLAMNIKKTQKRANALKNITIPKYERIVKDIQSALEEKEREEFTRLKVIKRGKLKTKAN